MAGNSRFGSLISAQPDNSMNIDTPFVPQPDPGNLQRQEPGNTSYGDVGGFGQKLNKEPKAQKNRQDDQDILSGAVFGMQQATGPKEPFEHQDSSKVTDKEIEDDFLVDQKMRARSEKRWKLSTRIANILLVLGCVYLIFLIFGVAVTEYHYTADGRVEAQRMTVQDIRDKKSYETILVQYEACRTLYENTLMLDYRIAAGEEDPMVIAPEYEALLEDVTNLSVKTDAAVIDAQYEQVKSMLLTWIKDDIAVYLQNMSAAISQNDEEKANNALQDKDRVYDDFSLITRNMIAMGETLPGVDLSDIRSWTPEEYVNQEINGTK